MSRTTGRGEQRRAALVGAAAGLLGEVGPAAVTARAVATRAEVPLAAVTYYFSTVDDLVAAAAEQLFEEHLAAADGLVRTVDGAAPTAWQEALVRVWLDPSPGGPDPDRVRGTLLQLASAAQAPALAPSLQRWDAGLVRLVEELLGRAGRDAGRARVLLAALDGCALARLCGVAVAAGVPSPPAPLLEALVADLGGYLDLLAPPVGAGAAAET